MRNITFNVSQEWFDKYKSGLKDKEYRAIKDKWIKALIGWPSQNKLLGSDHKHHVDFLREYLPKNPTADIKQWGFDFLEFGIVTICLGYPAKDDLERRITFKYLSTSIGYAEAGIGKELMGDDLVFVIQMEVMP